VQRRGLDINFVHMMCSFLLKSCWYPMALAAVAIVEWGITVLKE